jgi:chemotaxis protein histidine kinase CheA
MKTRTKVIITSIIVFAIVLGSLIVGYLRKQVDIQVEAQDDTPAITTVAEADEDEKTTETTTEKTTEKAKAEKTDRDKDSKKTTEKTTEATTEKATESKKTEPTTTESKPATTETAKTETTTEAPTRPSEPDTEAPAPVHEHSWYWVVDQAAYDEPIYEEQPVYETHFEHHDRFVYYWDNGWVAYSDAELWSQIDAYCAQYGVCSDACCFHYDGVWECTADCKEVKTQTGTQKVQTGTKHHDEVGHYECSCGATK